MKLIATDMDGTLLRSDKTISPRTLDALRFMTKNGGIFTIATGRMYAGIRQYLKILPFCKYAITTNGAEIYDCSTDKVIYSRPLESDLLKAILDFAQKNDLHLHIYSEDVMFTNRIDDYSRKYKKTTGISGTLMPEDKLSFFASRTAEKAVFMVPAEKSEMISADFCAQHGAIASVAQSASGFIEITSPSATKGLALEALANICNVSLNDVYAFGDSGNDMPMLVGSWHTRVPENGFECAKDVAEKIIESNDNDGVAKEIYKIFEEVTV